MQVHCVLSLALSVHGNEIMLMQTGWIQTSCSETWRLALDPTFLPLSLSFPNKKQADFQGFE